MDDILQLTLLYDFYGELLTDKQKQIYEMFYQNDLSLTEIGEELSITRQGVRDQLKRAEKKLLDYEETLHLVERFQNQNKAISLAKEKLEEFYNEVCEETHEQDRNSSKFKSLGEVIDLITNLLD